MWVDWACTLFACVAGPFRRLLRWSWTLQRVSTRSVWYVGYSTSCMQSRRLRLSASVAALLLGQSRVWLVCCASSCHPDLPHTGLCLAEGCRGRAVGLPVCRRGLQLSSCMCVGCCEARCCSRTVSAHTGRSTGLCARRWRLHQRRQRQQQPMCRVDCWRVVASAGGTFWRLTCWNRPLRRW